MSDDGDAKEPVTEKAGEGEELPASKDDSPKKDAKTTPRKTADDSGRAKKMFGGLLGQLQKAKTNLTVEKSAEKSKKMTDTKARVEEKLETKKAEYREGAVYAARAMQNEFGKKGKGMKGEMKGKGKGMFSDGKGLPMDAPMGGFRPMERSGMRSDGDFRRVGDTLREAARGMDRERGADRERWAPGRGDERDMRRAERDRDPRERERAEREERRAVEKQRAEREKERERDREKEKALDKERQEGELKAMYKRLARHYECMGHFIRTKVEPTIFYLPAQHNSKTRKLLAETQDAIAGKVKGLEAQAASVGRSRAAPARERSRSRNRDRDRRR